MWEPVLSWFGYRIQAGGFVDVNKQSQFQTYLQLENLLVYV